MFRWHVDDETELRLLEPRHAPELFALVDRDRDYLREWLPWVDKSREVADSEAFIRGALRRFSQGDALNVGIWFREEFAGVIGLSEIDQANRSASIGYWLGERFQGRGLMTKACRALVSYAFAELGLNRLEIQCAPMNRKSRAIPERLGFAEEGTLRQAEKLADGFVDLVVYGLLASEKMD